MIDLAALRKDTTPVEESLKKRGVDTAVVAQVLELDAEVRALQEKADTLRQQRNSGAKGKPTPEEIEAMKALREQIKEIEAAQGALEEKLFPLLASIPNTLHESVPVGESEDENVILNTVGEIPEFDFEPKPHDEIASVAAGIDTERGAKVSGARFYYLKGDVAHLERAIMNYAIDFIREKGFSLVLPPLMVKEHALYGTGYFPNGRNEVYAVNPGEDDLYLIGTSEQSLMAMHADEILPAEDLPLKYSGYSSCFRREAGSYGKDTKGILRVHQFNKTEMIALVDPAESWELHDKFVEMSTEFYSSLGLPIQVVQLCSGDTGAQSAKTIDIEAWFPSQQKYRELGSASNTTDYQTRRLKIRTKKNGETQLVHTLNNTVASDRVMLAVLENFQNADGSVTIPEVLRPYCGFDMLKA